MHLNRMRMRWTAVQGERSAHCSSWDDAMSPPRASTRLRTRLRSLARASQRRLQRQTCSTLPHAGRYDSKVFTAALQVILRPRLVDYFCIVDALGSF